MKTENIHILLIAPIPKASSLSKKPLVQSSN